MLLPLLAEQEKKTSLRGKKQGLLLPRKQLFHSTRLVRQRPQAPPNPKASPCDAGEEMNQSSRSAMTLSVYGKVDAWTWRRRDQALLPSIGFNWTTRVKCRSVSWVIVSRKQGKTPRVSIAMGGRGQGVFAPSATQFVGRGSA